MEIKEEELAYKVIQAQKAADFMLTPVGQLTKQFEITQRMATMYAGSTIVPDAYKSNVGNCCIAVAIGRASGRERVLSLM